MVEGVEVACDFWDRRSNDTLLLLISVPPGKARRHGEIDQVQGGYQGTETQRAHNDGQAQGSRISDVLLFISLLFVKPISGGDGRWQLMAIVYVILGLRDLTRWR
jgi:hypothetical protein